MKAGITIDYLKKPGRTLEQAARLCREAGFTYLDFTPDISVDSWKEDTLQAMEIFSKYSLKVHQTHAPMNRYRAYDGLDFDLFTRRYFEATAMMGAEFAVAHADEFRVKDRFIFDQILATETNRLMPYAEYCAEHGVTLCIENLFEDGCHGSENGKSRFTSRIEELLAVQGRLPNTFICWDFGHARMAYGDGMTDALAKCAPLIRCTHIHDNYYNRDLHLLPFTGNTNWKSEMQLLAQAGYKGVLNLELVYGAIPDGMIEAFLATAYEAVRKLDEYMK